MGGSSQSVISLDRKKSPSVMAIISIEAAISVGSLSKCTLSHMRFGSVAVTSKLRTGAVYRVYLRFALYLALFVILAVGFGIALLYAVDLLLARNTYAALHGLACHRPQIGTNIASQYAHH